MTCVASNLCLLLSQALLDPHLLVCDLPPSLLLLCDSTLSRLNKQNPSVYMTLTWLGYHRPNIPGAGAAGVADGWMMLLLRRWRMHGRLSGPLRKKQELRGVGATSAIPGHDGA
jgi:hypothetical protein